MPVSNRKPPVKLRVPQARVLAALQPDDPTDPPIDWPVVSLFHLAKSMGVSPASETTRRALRGLAPGSRSGTPHLGLLALGLVVKFVFDIDGLNEDNYQVTPAGVRAYRDYTAERGELPKLRDKASCTNDRYKKKSDEDSENGT